MKRLLVIAALALWGCPPDPEVPVGPKPKPIGQDAAVLPDGALGLLVGAMLSRKRGG